MATKKTTAATKAPAKKAVSKAVSKAVKNNRAAVAAQDEGEEEEEETASESQRKGSGKALVSYDEMLARLGAKGQEAAEREANTGAGGVPYMNTQGKEFTLPGDDGEEFGESIDCVVVASAFFNAWYDRPYVAGSGQVPACYAVALEEDDLAPPDDVPRKQADACAECPLNEWDSGPNGTGKACGNRRKLCIMLRSDLEEGVIRPIMLSLPPTALKFWGRYVKALYRQHKIAPAGVITRFTFDEDNPQPCPVPEFESLIPRELLGLVFPELDAAEELVLQKIDTSSYEPPEEGRKNNKIGRRGAVPAKKAAGGRRR